MCGVGSAMIVPTATAGPGTAENSCRQLRSVTWNVPYSARGHKASPWRAQPHHQIGQSHWPGESHRSRTHSEPLYRSSKHTIFKFSQNMVLRRPLYRSIVGRVSYFPSRGGADDDKSFSPCNQTNAFHLAYKPIARAPSHPSTQRRRTRSP